MRLKKINASIALFTILVLITHIGVAFRSLGGWVHPITIIMPRIIMSMVVIHALLSMCILLFVHDGNDMRYAKFNLSTILQRVSGIFMLVPLIFSHVKIYNGSVPKTTLYAISEITFFALVLTHIATSLSKALITLGLIKSEKKIKVINIIVYVICGVLMLDFGAMVVRNILL